MSHPLAPNDCIQILRDAENPRRLVCVPYAAVPGSDGKIMRGNPSFNLVPVWFKALWPDVEERPQHHEFVCGFTDKFILALEQFAPGNVKFASNADGQALKEELEKRRKHIQCLDDVVLLKESMTALFESGEYNEETGSALLPAACEEVVTSSDPNKRLKAYQRAAVYIAATTKGHDWWMEQGTGKTPTAVSLVETIALARHRTNEHQVRLMANLPDIKAEGALNVLCIVPGNLRKNWTREFMRFSGVPRKFITRLSGGPADRRFALKSLKVLVGMGNFDYTATVTSYDNFQADLATSMELAWDLVLIDESQLIKDPGTNRAKALLGHIPLMSKCTVAMTGTPLGNSVMDLWSQMEVVRAGSSGASDFKSFKQMHGTFEVVGPGVESFVAPQNVPELRQTVARNAFCVRKKHVMRDLPALTWEVIECAMSADQAKAYKSMATEMAVMIEAEMRKGTSTEHVLTQLLRLAQITAGFIGTEETVDVHTQSVVPAEINWFSNCEGNKVSVLQELMANLPKDEKAIIWSPQIPALFKIRDALSEYNPVIYYGSMSTDEKDAAVTRHCEDRDCRVIVANPAAAGAGLTLIGYPPGRGAEYETDTTLMVFYSHNWSWLQRDQAAARPHRHGTRRPVRAVDLVVPSTIDEILLDRLENKKEQAVSMVEVGDILRNLKDALRNFKKQL